MQLLLVGANHKSAGLSLREKLSFANGTTGLILNRLLESETVQEAVLLSTCNRTEIYAIVQDPLAARQQIVAQLSQEADLDPAQIESILYTYYNKFAASHLFEVASGLDSMVLGENEILRQVKSALELSSQLESIGPVLNQLFRFAITAGKRVRTETAINRGISSMASLAAKLVRENRHPSPRQRLLILGAGQMARVLLRNLSDLPLDITLINRTLQNAENLRPENEGITAVLPLNELEAAMQTTDALVVCTSYNDYLIHPEQLMERTQPLLLVDLSVPRNVHPLCAKLPEVELHDVDDLQDQITLSLEQRSHYVAQAQSIIAEEATSFLDWFHNREMVPTIRGLYEMFEEIRQREIERGVQKYKQELAPEAEAVLERITKAITQKILHHPVARLKNAPPQDQHLYQEALNHLFGISAEDEIDKYVHLKPQQQKSHRLL